MSYDYDARRKYKAKTAMKRALVMKEIRRIREAEDWEYRENVGKDELRKWLFGTEKEAVEELECAGDRRGCGWIFVVLSAIALVLGFCWKVWWLYVMIGALFATFFLFMASFAHAKQAFYYLAEFEHLRQLPAYEECDDEAKREDANTWKWCIARLVALW